MKKNKNKKVLIIILLIIFTFIGLAGYGVYSYYWTQGSFEGTDTVTIASFDPRTYIDNDDFLGNGGTVSLSCYVSGSNQNNNRDNMCTGSLTIHNNGDTDIVVTVSNASVTTRTVPCESGTNCGHSAADDMTVYPETPSFSWTTKTIAPGEDEYLDLEVYTEVSDGFGSDTSIFAEESIHDYDSYHNAKEVYVSFKLKAEQAHE